MASIMIFGTAWGIALGEWKGTGVRTRSLMAVGLVTLVISTIIVGYGNYLAVRAMDASERLPASNAVSTCMQHVCR